MISDIATGLLLVILGFPAIALGDHLLWKWRTRRPTRGNERFYYRGQKGR